MCIRGELPVKRDRNLANGPMRNWGRCKYIWTEEIHKDIIVVNITKGILLLKAEWKEKDSLAEPKSLAKRLCCCKSFSNVHIVESISIIQLQQGGLVIENKIVA